MRPLGVQIINDVSGFTDPGMVKVAADSKCGCIVMHWNKEGLERMLSARVALDDSRPARPKLLVLSRHSAALPLT